MDEVITSDTESNMVNKYGVSSSFSEAITLNTTHRFQKIDSNNMSDPPSSPGQVDPAQVSPPKIYYWETIPYEIREQNFASIDGFTEAPTDSCNARFSRRTPPVTTFT